MSQEVAFNANDYRTITGWFDRLFGKGKEPDNDDRMTYQKLIVMAMAYTEEMAQLGNGHDDRVGKV